MTSFGAMLAHQTSRQGLQGHLQVYESSLRSWQPQSPHVANKCSLVWARASEVMLLMSSSDSASASPSQSLRQVECLDLGLNKHTSSDEQ